MRFEALETRIDEFDQRNLVLQGMLGMLSTAERLDAILDREAPVVESGRAGVVHDEDRLLIEFVLGLISFRQTLGHIVTDASVQGGRELSVDSPDPAAGDALFRGVLR